MTITQLEYIIAVDTHRHFAKAAEASFVTQPTLSMQIQKLEQELGVTIFDRSRQPVVPTDIGRRVILQARQIVNESRKIREIIEDEKKEVAGELRLGIIPTLAPYLLPLFIGSFIEKYPGVTLQVEELLTEQVLMRLKQDQIDIGLIVTPSNDPGVLEQPVFYEEFYAYLSPRHPLYRQETLKADEIDVEDVWLLNEGHCFREQVLNICGRQGVGSHGNFRYQSGSLEALRKIVDRQGGFTLLPELASMELGEESKSKVRPFAEPRPVREVSLVMHRSFLKRKLVEALRHEIIDNLPPLVRQKTGNTNTVKWR
ncbi:LysR substrate-binding domain-containing protein [Roseivirga sp. BDSF3-8]|uniref:hydrogen peroxide-inducible genes activator n=1 Tax=Roseivirga sp. BDSF3-8 TaxID=3241598 RepID=UPI003531CF61